MSERYKVVKGSESGHCCFKATVVDTHTPDPLIPDELDWVCECFDMESAQKIVDALNAASQPAEQQTAPDVACSQSRESAMVVLEQGPDGTPAVWCDPEIADLVSALNKAGIRTVASCSGHGHRPGNIMLSDGRELAIARDFDEARKIDAMFPGINGEPPMVDVKALVRLDDYEALQAELEQWKNGSTIRDEQNEELHQYVLELKTEIEELRKDAERYRFLCNPSGAEEDYLSHAVNTLNSWADKIEIDQAVDSAMRERYYMTTDQITHHLNRWQHVMQAMDGKMRDLYSLTGYAINPLSRAVSDLQIEYTRLLSEHLEWDYDDLQDWWLEQEFGANPMRAGFVGEDMREIRDNSDLARFIHDSKAREGQL